MNTIAFADGKTNIFKIAELLNVTLDKLCKEYRYLKMFLIEDKSANFEHFVILNVLKSISSRKVDKQIWNISKELLYIYNLTKNDYLRFITQNLNSE